MSRSPVFHAGVLLLLAACGEHDLAPGAPPRAPRTVMVIDNGFDQTLPIFRDKVAATYTLVCDDADAGAGPDDAGAGENDGGASDASVSFAERKAAFLAELAVPDEHCHLQPGVAPVANPLADLESMRAAWNATILADRLAIHPNGNDLDPLFETIGKRLGDGAFHGTATSGVIAEENDAVSLVLVSRAFDTAPSSTAKLPCISADDIAQATALLSDPEVQAAYVARPLAAGDRALYQAMRDHGVLLVNESYGHLSRLAVEEALAESGCPIVSLADYFAVTEKLDDAQRRAHMPPSVLLVKAAGNDGTRLADPGDDLDCRPGDGQQLRVGSYDLEHRRSSFSNFGPCVDLYAPGELVIAPLPGGWLYPVSGTSFAAPLVTRWLTDNEPDPFDGIRAREDLLARREPDGDIPLREFPARWLYDPRPNVHAPAAPVRPRLELTPLTPGADARRTKLWPLHWVARGR